MFSEEVGGDPTMIVSEDPSRHGRKMVGAVRFELTTSCTRNKRATRLRYAPTQGREKVPGLGTNCNVQFQKSQSFALAYILAAIFALSAPVAGSGGVSLQALTNMHRDGA